MTARVRVSLLGPVEARVEDDQVPIAGAKLQALLALLALSAPQAVSDDRIIDEIWGDEQPRNPVNALQAQVSQLRRVIGRDAITRDTFGYALSAEVDVEQFEQQTRAARRAAADGDHRAAAECFAGAISLVNGPPLGDLLDHRFAREAASRLDQLLIGAREGYVDAELALGHHASVLPFLLDFVVMHPLWERFHGQLMIALFRCGRQSDALRAYQHARAVLVEEMGVEPGPELRALEQAVLSHDPSLVAPIQLATKWQRTPMPVRTTQFVGRIDELHGLGDATREARLVTIVGPAGVGKSRLALELVAGLAAEQEVWFVELAAISDPAHLAESVALALGAELSTPGRAGELQRTPDERIVDRFGDRAVIVVLDNCEHLRAAVVRLAKRVLTGCERLHIVATSREPLGLDGEHQFGLGPLSEQDANVLFTVRARAVQPGFIPDGDEITELCHHLDRLPLAIELAAARTKTMPVTEIAARLSDRFVVLTRDGSSTERHGELRAAIDWSYDMLFEPEQRLFRQLAVFTGGVTLDVAERMFGSDAIDGIARLVDKSLLLADTTGRTARFGMLETLRDYGLDRLAAAGELAGAGALHCGWCIDLAQHADAGIRGREQVAWLDQLDAEHDNLRAALAYAVEADPLRGLQLIGALILPWWFRGRGREARRWVDACLDAVRDAPSEILAKALTWSGLLADFDGRDERRGLLEHELRVADQRLRDAITLSIETGNDLALAYARSQRSLALIRAALAGVHVDMTEVATLIDEAMVTFERLGDHFGAGTTRTMEAVAALADGRLEDAAVIAERARLHALHSGDRFVLGRAEWIAGLAADAAGDSAEAYRRVEHGLRLLDELGMRGEVTGQAALLATLADKQNEPDLAAQWRRFVAARNGGLNRHDGLLVAAAKNSEGLRARSFGDFEHARDAHLAALASYRDADVLGAIAYTESCLGFLAVAMNDLHAARQHHASALTHGRVAGDDRTLALALEGVATIVDAAHVEWSATLLGASDDIRSRTDGAAPATHREDTDAATRRAKTAMGAPDFEAAWARGRAMNRSEVIALAFAATKLA